jgi:hypothetical protein
LLGACGGSSRPSVSATPTTTVAADATTSTQPLPTTSLPCQPIPMPLTPVTGAPTTQPVLLTGVRTVSDSCVDHVVFDFAGTHPDAPGYTVSYGSPPFAADASGAHIAVAGNAFITVRLAPAYGYDPATYVRTYNGKTRIAGSGAKYVTEIVQTGDFEGVVNWVIGLSEKRPFTVQATGAPSRQLVVTVS